MQVGNRDVNPSHPAADRSRHPWVIRLEDKRSDTETPETHLAVAEALRMDPMADLVETIGAYVRGDGGEDPPRIDLLINPMQRALLGSHGIDPVRLLHAQNLGLGFTVVVVHTDDWWDTSSVDDAEAPRLSGVTFMAPGIRHFTDGEGRSGVSVLEPIHGVIPETAAGALVGRPLSDLLDHGLGFDPIVEEVTRFGQQDIFRLRTEDWVSIRKR